MPGEKSSAANTLPLLFACFAAISSIYVAERFLEDKIASNKAREALDALEAVMPLAYDNKPLEDKIVVTLPANFGKAENTHVYRARFEGEPVGLVFNPIKANGYNGTIEISIGIQYDGVITGVRILRHRETRGLGDQVDQNNSDWLFGFNGRSLANTPRARWAVIKDGGDFDQLSGATISPRAVLQAVAQTLSYYETNRQNLF